VTSVRLFLIVSRTTSYLLWHTIDKTQEGILTLSVGLWSAFGMARSPTQTKCWYRPKGWFTEREESKLTFPMALKV
jgi:hypothetical protein